VTDNPEELSAVAQQKMRDRAERHVRERQAAEEERGREAQALQVAQDLAVQAQQVQAEAGRQREAAAEARHSRPDLVVRYKRDPVGLRHVATLRDVCLNCGSENIRTRADQAPHVRVCWECSAEWFASGCWSCTTGLLDSRDPETPPCKQCGWPKCAICGACNPQGCSTNPYNASHRQRDEVTVPLPSVEGVNDD